MQLLPLFAALLAAVTAIAEPSLPYGTTPIPLEGLATTFTPTARQDASAVESIRNTLALYPFAIDGKNFAALSNVFAEHAVANYSAPLNVLTPRSTIESLLAASLACVTTQHQLGTQLIKLVSPTVAESITYYRAAHFGTGNQTDRGPMRLDSIKIRGIGSATEPGGLSIGIWSIW